MKKFRVLAPAFAAAALLAGCGGSDPGDQTPTVKYDRMVNFGDSLSDVGTYRTQLVAASGGGKYSINGGFSKEGINYTNWTEFLASVLQVAQPCPNEVGLQSVGGLAFMAQAVADNPACFSYAQGGARVTDPHGPGNAYYYTVLGSPSGQLGQITKPVVQQVADFLAVNASFSATDIVTVLAGGNDVFIDRGVGVDGTVAYFAAQGLLGTDAANAAISAAAANAVLAMQQAGTEEASLVLDQIVAHGATHVVVVNLPDVAGTPDQTAWLAAAGAAVEPLHPHLTLDMVNAFNTALATGLGVSGADLQSSNAAVLYVDAFTASDQQNANPAQFGLTNVTSPACDLTKTGVQVPGVGLVPLASSLFCTKDSLVVDEATAATYEFADTVHPTPYGYKLLAQLVSSRLIAKGWL